MKNNIYKGSQNAVKKISEKTEFFTNPIKNAWGLLCGGRLNQVKDNLNILKWS